MLLDLHRVSRVLAARALASEANPARIRLVGEYSRDTEPWARYQAMIAAGRMGEPGLPVALTGLGDPAPLVRQAAVWAVTHGGADGLERVTRLLATERDPSVLETALANLWRFGDHGWEASVLRFAGHDNPGLRRAAAVSLARSERPSRIDGLRRLARDREPVIRATATAGYGAGSITPADVELVLQALRDEDWRVRAAACDVLARRPRIEVPEDEAQLVAALWTDRRGQLAVPALRAGGRHSEIGSDQLLTTIIGAGEPWTASEALLALASRAPEPALEVATEWGRDSALWRRRSAARALVDLPASLTGKLVDGVISDPEPSVRLAWLEALDEGAAGERVDALWKLVRGDPDAMVRARCVDLLGQVGELGDADRALALSRRWVADDVGDARAAALVAALESASADVQRAVLEAAAADADLQVRALVVNAARRLGLEATVHTGEPRRSRTWYRDLVRWVDQRRWLDVVTVRGTFRIRLELEETPITAREVWELAEAGFYDGLTFHRVVPNFVVQGGDPRGDGWGGPGFLVPDEPSLRPFDSYRVGIATSGPQTGGSQLFVTLLPADRLTGHYTNLGEVVAGREVLTRLQAGDRIVRVETVTGDPSPGPTPVLLDRLTWDQLEGLDGWEQERADYLPDPLWVDQLTSFAGSARIIVVLGTWCSDSRREVPRLKRVLQEVGDNGLEMVLVGVDRTKRIFVDGLTDDLSVGSVVDRVPTVVVVDETGIELGRIVETAESPMEELLARFLLFRGQE
jgi:cyclophilin family peptidyl-prolyl cis-trans isomerase/HEAT repeat protein